MKKSFLFICDNVTNFVLQSIFSYSQKSILWTLYRKVIDKIFYCFIFGGAMTVDMCIEHTYIHSLDSVHATTSTTTINIVLQLLWLVELKDLMTILPLHPNKDGFTMKKLVVNGNRDRLYEVGLLLTQKPNMIFIDRWWWTSNVC